MPWYLSYSNDSKEIEDSYPDYIIASGQNTVSACLHLSKVAKNSFSGIKKKTINNSMGEERQDVYIQYSLCWISKYTFYQLQSSHFTKI